ncbi:MAG: hypothetical protein QOD07_2675, partial [Frankiaceae bacterium]|nr:hypothetical protein [Frankiaceae bacterium]
KTNNVTLNGGLAVAAPVPARAPHRIRVWGMAGGG